jgi:PAS domain S-box-containing protein
MNATPDGEPGQQAVTEDGLGLSALQRMTAPDSWIAQVLPGVLAISFIVIVVLAVMAGEGALMASARQTNRNTLETVLTSTIQRFEDWAQNEESHARIWSDNALVIQAMEELSRTPVREALRTSPIQQELRDTMGPWLAEYGFRSFYLISDNGTTIAALRDSDLGVPSSVLDHVDGDRMLATGAFLTRPHIVDVLEPNEHGGESEQFVEIAQMYVVAPVQVDGRVAGHLAFRLDPAGEYAAAFRVGRTGLSGETYAVDVSGRLLTETRYETDLQAAGLIADGHPGMLHIEVRDPGVDLTAGGAQSRPYSAWPLTEAATSVTQGNRDNNLRGYRDARGVLVIGAWIWDHSREIGVITEIEVAEALAGANQARAVLRVFAVAMALSFILLAVLFSAHRNVIRRRAEVTLEAKQRLSQILMTAAEGIYGIDGAGVITFANRRACEMLGYTEDELIGKSMHTMVHHSHRDGSLYPREDCPIHTSGVPIEDASDETFWSKSGQPIPIEYASSPIDPEDKVLGAVITFRDITKRKRDEMALHRYAHELKRSNAELQEFAYAASHDLQEPLRKIQAFGERLNNKYQESFDDTGRHYLERMVDAATRMRRLIDDLLSYSRVNTRTTSFLPVDLGAVIADVLSDLEPRITSEQATIRVGELPAIEADPSQMHQLFLNLIANSLKFRRPGVTPSVTIEGSVEVGENGAVARIAVADNGVGFEPRHAERIFGMFERLHGREEYDGTGVGLATCRKIAERHAGELSAWGEPDAGAVFTMVLPIRQASLD